MAAVSYPVERQVILSGVSWGTYERLQAEHEDHTGTRFTYNEGDLEIKVVSARHEEPNRTLAALIEVVAEEFGLDFRRLGSTTFQRENLLKGFEPDSAYYFTHATTALGRDVDPAVDPPPDLIIEVDIARLSLDRFPIFAAFGVPEVWRYDGTRVAIFRLETGSYLEAPSSLALPALTGEMATRFVDESRQLSSTQWIRRVREWARQQR